MTLVTPLHPALPAAGPAPDSPRQAAIAAASVLIVALLRCVVWLIRHGVYVTGFVGTRQAGADRIVVSVAPSPLLHHLLPDCAWRARRQDGELIVYTWFAVRFGLQIEWEEACAS